MDRADPGTRAASPVIGNILVVALVIVLGALVVTFGLTFAEDLRSTSPNVATETSVTDGEIRLYHRAGEVLDTSNLEVVVETSNETTRIPFSQGRLTGAESTFGAGQRWRYCQVATPGTDVETTVVHTPTNSVIARLEQSAAETKKTGLEYRCGSAVRQVGRNGGWVTLNMTNYADEKIEIVGLKISSDAGATRLEGLNSSGVDHTDVYIDATGGAFTFNPSSPGADGIAYSTSGAGPFDVDSSPQRIDLTSSPGFAFDTAVIQPGNTARFSIYQFQDSTGSPANMRTAELTVKLYFANRESRTYSIILPVERSDG